MNTSLMFSIIVVLIGEIWVICSATSVRKNGPVYHKDTEENPSESEDDYKRDISNSAEQPDIQITPVATWPNKDIKFGQVSGVSIDTRGNVYVFHRVDRVWGVYTFFGNDTYSDIDLGPISKPTVAVIHPESGNLLYEWGSNMFYLPHGITVDRDNNVWVTDVALHQVFKFPPIYPPSANNTVPLLTLGTAFLNGHNSLLFCKPTSVAVLPNGDFFVADGYCNSRIIKYSADGKQILSWGRSTFEMGSTPVPSFHFNVPHDLTLMEDKNALCVSDRENDRLQCFHAANCTFINEIKLREVGSRVFAATYTPAAGGLFFMVNSPINLPIQPFLEKSHGSVVDAYSERFLKAFQPQGTTFRTPHDIIISANATELYVAELDPHRVWKFKLSNLYISETSKSNENQLSLLQGNQVISTSKSSGTMVMAMIITAAVLCFGAALLVAALIYSRARTRGCSGQCKNPKWLVGRSSVEGFNLGNFLGQQHQGFIKLNNFEESDEDESNASPTFA